ncbi:MAG: hypothetical protein K2G49_12430 [Muribaculum sp.]|nr:hypothetical protein [Muribaculum sp.]
MEKKKVNYLGIITGAAFAVGVMSMAAVCGVTLFSFAETFSDVLPHDFHGVVGALVQILMLYIGIEVFTRAYNAGFTLGYKVDGAILAACVLFAMYFGDFIHVIAPVGVVLGVAMDVIATGNKRASISNN